jgi:tetratricopeptide (TPR) repeat protein
MGITIEKGFEVMLVNRSSILRALSSLFLGMGALSLALSPVALGKEKEKKEKEDAGGGAESETPEGTSGSTAGSTAGGGGDVKSLLQQGLYSYDEGDFDAAVLAFEKAFALDPSSDAILDFVEKATQAKVFSMIRSKDSRLAGIGKQILKSSIRVITARAGDPELIKKAVSEVLQSEGQDQVVLMIRHSVTYGRNLVPALIPVLGDNDLGRRTTAINWIGRHIRLEAVAVLQAARKHPDSTVRTNVASLLGVRPLRHVVSLATLKAMVETDSATEVKEAAAKSLKAILSDLNGQGKELSAKEYFLDNAYNQYYLNPHQNPFRSAYYVPTVYKLVGGSVVGEEVADFQLSGRMAQQALEEALELDPSFLEAWVLTLCNDAAQVVQYDQNVAYYAKHESQTNIKELLEKQKSDVNKLRNRILASRGQVLSEGLMQALDNGRSDVAQKIIEVMRETRRRGQALESLVKALEDPNSRLVRTTAAVALAHWNPSLNAGNANVGDHVVSVLSEAVVSSGIRTVQKVMGNQQESNRIDEILRSYNMESYTPIDTIERGFDAVVSSPPDLVIMDESVTLSAGGAGGATAPINYFVNELRKNYRSANVPVVVVVPAAQLDAAKKSYQSEERKVWVVPDTLDRTGFKNIVFDKIFQEKDDAKALATRVAKTAAEAIEYASSVATRLPLKKSITALKTVLKDRPDEVRIPCIKALGGLRAEEAVGELAVVFANPENSHEVRREAMRAVGQALQSSKGATAPVLKIILGGMEDLDLELRAVSWYAFSNSGADPKTELNALLLPAPAASSGTEGTKGGDTKSEGGAAEAKPEAKEEAPGEEKPGAEKPEAEKPEAETPEGKEPPAGDEKPKEEESKADDSKDADSKSDADPADKDDNK